MWVCPGVFPYSPLSAQVPGETQSVSISCVLADDLAVFLARQQLMNDRNL